MKHWRWTLFLMIFCAHAWGASVAFQDVAPSDLDWLKQQLPQAFGANVNYETLDQVVRALMTKGSYENVYIEESLPGAFVVMGKPIRIVDAVEFHGARQIQAAELRDLIDVKVGDRFDRKRAVQAAEKIKNYYGEHGFFNAVVELDFQKTEKKDIQLIFTIQENAPCMIRGLTFVTANTDLKARLDAHFRKLKDKALTTDRARDLNQQLETMLIENRYLATEVIGPEVKYNDAKTAASLQFEVREPYRYEFYFYGNQFASLTDLYHALDLGNKERRNVDPAGEGAERLRRFYLARGFANVSIETRVENPEKTYLRRVRYVIQEGPRVRIKALDVQGRISRPTAYYYNFIINNSADLIQRGYYDRVELENGFKNLTTELRNEGFLRARILSSRVEFNEKRDHVVVTVLIDEGPQTQIRSIDFEGNKFISDFELTEVTGLRTNAPLRLNAFEQSLERLKTFYHNQGFLEMRLMNESEDIIEYNTKGTQARIVFRIYEGPRIRVNSIVVEGNQMTKSRVILKEADLRLGEVLTPEKIDEATARLNKMGLFSRADIRTLEEGTSISQRTVVISVTERDPGVFRIGMGVNNERKLTLRGFAGMSYNNLGGTARGVSARAEVKQNVAEIKYPEHEVTLGYLEPFLFGTRTRGRVNLTRSEYVFKYESKEQVTRISTSNRVDFLAERDLTRHTRLTWKTWSLESNKEFERYGRCISSDPKIPFDPNAGHCPPTVIQIATIGPTLDVDYRDNPFLPTRGSFTRLVTDYSSPALGSTDGIQFIRTEGNYTYYKPLGSPRWVWANSARSGYVANLSRTPGSGVPTSYAFVLGGIYTLRGFDVADDDERVPRNGNDGFKITSRNQKLIKTDSHYFLVKSELRFPLYNDFGGVLFYDGGAVFVSGYHFDRPYRDAVGFGFRYNTPVGPLAADFGFKISPRHKEEAFRFHLSIGTF